jgi:beta-glucosidase
MQTATQQQQHADARIEDLLNQMTLEEQVSLLAGADFWRTVPIPRLNIP